MEFDKMELTFRYSTSNFKGANTLKAILKYKRSLGEWEGKIRCYKLGKIYYIEQWEYKDQINNPNIHNITIE